MTVLVVSSDKAGVRFLGSARAIITARVAYALRLSSTRCEGRVRG